MASSSKKQKLETKPRTFNENWESEYFFMEVKGKPVCLICGESVAVNKDYNLKRHYDTTHIAKFGSLIGDERARKVTELKR